MSLVAFCGGRRAGRWTGFERGRGGGCIAALAKATAAALVATGADAEADGSAFEALLLGALAGCGGRAAAGASDVDAAGGGTAPTPPPAGGPIKNLVAKAPLVPTSKRAPKANTTCAPEARRFIGR